IILSGTPVLETLINDSCCGFEFIYITNESVKNFVICGSSTEDIDTLQINDPHIQSLTIKDKFDLAAILLLNMSSVVQAKLDYRTTYNFYNMGMHEHHRIELLKGLILIPHIKELEVGKFCLEIGSLAEFYKAKMEEEAYSLYDILLVLGSVIIESSKGMWIMVFLVIGGGWIQRFSSMILSNEGRRKDLDEE
ncbi:hypothetical protein Tco_0724188, partial [Tanacetum coccineum]